MLPSAGAAVGSAARGAMAPTRGGEGWGILCHHVHSLFCLTGLLIKPCSPRSPTEESLVIWHVEVCKTKPDIMTMQTRWQTDRGAFTTGTINQFRLILCLQMFHDHTVSLLLASSGRVSN